MKKIKLFLLITLIITMCTGCSIEYNITINKDTIEEVINVTDNITENRTQSDILSHYNMWYPTFVNYIPTGMETIEIEDYNIKADYIEYHEKFINETSNGYNYTYKYNYNINNYYDASSLYNSYIESTVLNQDNVLVLRTKEENLLCEYDYFESLKVNITIDPEIYKINYINTLNINNNTYTWYLDRNNCNSSEIILTLDKIKNLEEDIIDPNDDNKNKDNKTDKDNNKKDYTMYIFYGILLLIIIIGYFIFKKMKNKSESFGIDD